VLKTRKQRSVSPLHSNLVSAQRADSTSTHAHESTLTDREKNVLRAIRRDPEANKSLDFLSRKTGCSVEDLIINFVQEAWGPRSFDELDAWVDMWPELKSFACKLKELALRMKVLNQLSDWNLTALYAGLVAGDRGRLEKAFRELPDLMLLYARNVETKSETIRRYEKVDPGPHGKVLELVFANELSRWLRQRTGRSYRDHVVAIQRVTYREAGRKRIPASGETLRKRDLRGKKAFHPVEPS
jgi:hypothetical protein